MCVGLQRGVDPKEAAGQEAAGSPKHSARVGREAVQGSEAAGRS